MLLQQTKKTTYSDLVHLLILMLCPLEGLSEFHDSFCILRMQIGATERTEGKVEGSKKRVGMMRWRKQNKSKEE